MNYKMCISVLGKLLGVEGVLLLLPALVSVIYGELNETFSFVSVSLILIFIFLCTARVKPKRTKIYGKEGFFIVATVWIFWSVFGCLPFVISGEIPHVIDAFFETVSGFTTTGATILTDVESMSNGMLFWRSLTHWIGGMGVLVFVMAVMPVVEKRYMHLMRAEMPGPSVDKLVPKARDTAKILYGMYLGLSVIMVIFLLFGGMNLFDSLIHMFGTAGTGGFSNKAASVGFYNSPYIDMVISVFMILFGVNFNIFFFLLMKRSFKAFQSTELYVYLGIVVSATVLIAVNISHMYKGPLQALRYSFFQVSSIISTSGFVTSDFDLWPEFSKALLMVLMVTGACAGSTGGGMKISRVVLLVKTMFREINHIFRPQAVNIVRLDKKRVDQEVMDGVYGYLVAYILILITSIILLSLDNFNFVTNFSATLTCIGNVGPGLGAVGPTQSFFGYTYFSKTILSFVMLIGRLEIFPFFILVSPSLWRRKF